ncbi:cysteine hydrolase [soil metagenome]
MNVSHLPDWAVKRGRYINHFTHVEASKTAVLNIDMQNIFMAPGQIYGNPHAMDIVDNVNRLTAACREAGARVVWTRQTYSHDPVLTMPAWQYDRTDPTVIAAIAALEAGTPAQALHPAMQVQPSDVQYDKYRYSAFLSPDMALKPMLDGFGVDTLIVTGTLTNCCCESTARDGNLLGFRVFFISDATAAVTDEEHNAALLNLRLMFADVRTTDEMLALLATSQ